MRRRLEQVDEIGRQEMVAVAQLGSRLTLRSRSGSANLFSRRDGVGRALDELRQAAERLSPARYRLQSRSRARAILFRRHDPLQEYMRDFAAAEEKVQALVGTLQETRSSLEADNAAIHDEIRSLTNFAGRLRRYAYLTARLDAALEAADLAKTVRTEALFAVRRRRQEILTQLAVSSQALAALELAGRNNDLLIRAIHGAVTTTITALRTGVLVAHVLSASRQVDEQVRSAAELVAEVDALNAPEAAGSPTPLEGQGVAQLQHAWNRVYRALDEVETFRRGRPHQA